jgi:S-formylglutathione hydrolase FrmB
LRRYPRLISVVAAAIIAQSAVALPFCHRHDLALLNRRICGHVIDYTKDHGADRRIWSPALCQKRDMYIYVPPGFDCGKQYPAMLWLHGFMEDEQAFIQHAVPLLDSAIRCGRLPPLIAIAPDGSLNGEASYLSAGSFFVNSKAGRFEDYIIQDVWGFLLAHYPIRPEREAHVIAGASMGGFGAYNLAMKYPDQFKLVVGILPPLNLRWVDCHGRYRSSFDPCCWGWRTQVNGHEVIGRFAGVITIRAKRLIDPLYGRGPDAIAAMSRENPIEMIDCLGIQNGLLDMYVAYAGRDEFNLDAQVESFLYRCRERGIDVTVDYDPCGHHSPSTAKSFFPSTARWMAVRLAPFAPSLEPGQVPEELAAEEAEAGQ